MNLKISEIANIQTGVVLSRKEAKKNQEIVQKYQRLTLKALGDDGFINKNELGNYNAKEKLDKSQMTQDGDVVLRLFSPLCPVLIGKETEGFVIPSQLAVLKVTNPEVILPSYLRWYLSQREMQERVLFEEGGTAQKTIKVGTIMDLVITVPDIETQKNIVKIDILSRKREQLYKELIVQERLYTESIIGNIIGGTRR